MNIYSSRLKETLLTLAYAQHPLAPEANFPSVIGQVLQMGIGLWVEHPDQNQKKKGLICIVKEGFQASKDLAARTDCPVVLRRDLRMWTLIGKWWEAQIEEESILCFSLRAKPSLLKHGEEER